MTKKLPSAKEVAQRLIDLAQDGGENGIRVDNPELKDIAERKHLRRGFKDDVKQEAEALGHTVFVEPEKMFLLNACVPSVTEVKQQIAEDQNE